MVVPRRDQAVVGRKSLRNLSTITPAWLLGKKVVTMAAIFGRGLERCGRPRGCLPGGSGAGSFRQGLSRRRPPGSTRVAARPSRRQGPRGKTRVERDNRMGRAEMARRISSVGKPGIRGLDHLPAAEPGHHPPPDRAPLFPIGRSRRLRLGVPDQISSWMGLSLLVADGVGDIDGAGAPDPGRSWSQSMPRAL